jgi:hypothetical protein
MDHESTRPITCTRPSIATFVNAAGLIEVVKPDVFRFDHNPDTLASKGLLLKEARTNLLLRTVNLMDTTYWTHFNAMVFLSPQPDIFTGSVEGSLGNNVFYLQSNTINFNHLLQGAIQTSNNVKTFSMHLKADTAA